MRSIFRIQQREEEVKRVSYTNLPSLILKGKKIQSTYSCIWRRSILGYPTSTTSPRSSTASSTSSSTSTSSSSVLNSVKLDYFVQRHIYFILCGHFAWFKDGKLPRAQSDALTDYGMLKPRLDPMLLMLRRGKLKSLCDLCGEVAARAALSVLFAAVRIQKKERKPPIRRAMEFGLFVKGATSCNNTVFHYCSFKQEPCFKLVFLD